MNFDRKYNPQCRMLLELNEFIHCENELFEYHMEHIKLVRRYSLLLAKRLHANVDLKKLEYAALAHDLFKERSLDPSKDGLVLWENHQIPQDLNKYVRSNLPILENFKLDDYFNTDVQLHPLSAGIFLYTEFGIKDPEILYPVMFHSCPIIDVYRDIPYRVRTMVDIMTLADKLSSNYLRINMREHEVRIDLDQAVFGSNGREFNYSLGLFLARLISQGKSKEEQSQISTEYYYKRLVAMNPIISKSYSIKKIGGNTKWPKRKSQAFKIH
jgi:HD superfamily phosphohydrolase YqeK